MGWGPMERICEPELMEDAAQVRAYAEADFSQGDGAMVERIRELFAAPTTANGTQRPGLGPWIVDLGCGPGNITLRIAAACPEARVLGIDGSPAMLAIAEQRRCADGALAGRLRFEPAVLPLSAAEARKLVTAGPGGTAGTASEGSASKGGFSAVLSNSLLHHLHDPGVLWATVRQLAAPGAALYLQDLRRPASVAAVEALVAREMATAPEVLRRDYRHSLQAAFTVEEVEIQLRHASLQGLRVQERGERYLEVWGRLGLTATCGA
jgi:trans-aconitate 2-methyltransferase